MELSLEELKALYPKVWEKYKGMEKEIAEMLFLEHVKAIQKIKKIEEKIEKITERERKREARALIILAKLLLQENPKLVKEILEKHQEKFQQKEGRVELDYSNYVRKILES
jgi:methyl coenzyme M reductase subunit C-like uncharacterized protein (methanogenesis marker protein 7)